MRIVHAPTEIAGQMKTLVTALREANHIVNGYNWFHTYLKYRGEIINTDAYELMKVIESIVNYVEIIHFHNGNSFVIHNADLPYLKQLGKPLIMHHWGNDVRTQAGALTRNRYVVPPSYMSDEAIHQRLLFLSKHIKHAIVQDYELYPYVHDYYEHVHLLPLACRTDQIAYAYPSASSLNPVIIHAPTNREFKGSVYVEKAIQDLKSRHAFTYIPVEKKSHQEAMSLYASSDIVVDQILCGTYGMLSVEAMAMGKVVVAYINDDVRAKFPADLPIVSANPDNIGSVLEQLLKEPERRHQIGIASRNYVEKYHDVKAVLPQLINIYNDSKGE